MRDYLVWVDLEMSGLDADTQVILEIAAIITDNNLEIIGQAPNIAIHYPKERLDTMEEWSRSHHESSGLMDRVRESKYDTEKAEEEILSFLSKYCEKGRCPLCGNSVWQDRRFLLKHMPGLEAFLHYRNIDVSSIKELVKRWYPTIPSFKKKKSHLALNDIKESINELNYYRAKIFPKF
ncbi:oligoribonuclease [Thermodesulfobacteriota bacterium]